MGCKILHFKRLYLNMYFEIENTPEPVKKKKIVEKEIEEVPTLILKPFTRAPQVIFENVPIGVRVERYMNIVNPTQQSLRIFLGKALPQELKINLVEGSLLLDPQDCVSVTLCWTPLKPTTHRETIHFTDQNRGRYDVAIVFKSVVVKKLISKKKLLRTSPTKLSTKKIGVISPKVKNRGATSKGVRKSPDKLERRSSKHHVKSIPVAQQQQLQNLFIDFHLPKHDPLTVRKFELQDSSLITDSFYSGTSDKENKSPLNLVNYIDKSKVVRKRQCLSSPNSVLCEIENLNFTPLKGFHHQQAAAKHNYTELNDVSLFKKDFYETDRDSLRLETANAVKGQENNRRATDIIDNFNFTPLRNDLRDCKFEIDTPSDIRRETYAVKQFPAKDFIRKPKNPKHSPNKSYPVIDLCNSVDTSIEYLPTKHVPEILSNGKSALMVDVTVNKENTTINIDTKELDDYFLRKPEMPSINVTFNNLEPTNLNDTNMTFKPHVCSTERKSGEMGHKENPSSHICRGLFDNDTFHQGVYGPCNSTMNQLNLGTCNKGDSPIVPLDPKNPNNIQSSPYSTDPQCVDGMQGVTLRDQSKSLMFEESKSRRIFIDRNCADGVRSIIEADMWQKEVKNSPLRSLTPPLMSIPEESTQNLDSHIIGKGDTYTFNRTYDHCKVKLHHYDNYSLNHSRMSTTTDANLWKVPTASVRTIRNKQQSESTYHAVNPDFLIGNVYTSSSTIDPFLSATYFYDEQSVDRFEQEFKRWLNYLLTPPAEFETDGVKIDLGKIWIETKNKEIPAAPTREQVSSQYHNSHRLDSLRKAARNLLMTPQMSQVLVKLGAQIDKQIISIRKDKCLHLDIGLQKLILDILFCYNPLWLRIGLEVIYGTVIPLSSNSDMYGLSVFIIQHMFKDPYMSAKHQNHKTPNMLREAYTEQMKKFTLKKYFMLVYFLDQAKQKKLICHDPCLFRRNAPSKESRDMLIRFTREVIAGIGDITKHLRPLGYVVTHKQSYLDEYKYAVHNLAVDLKDGIRLTKVMEIILVKDNLTKNLRTPPISLLQKVHNCRVALQALNDANFNIVGDITPRDIVDGHREKTLSLLWQIIHVFRAPLFIKASITIQAWWRNKYLGIIVRKRIEHKKLMVKHNAASVLQIWWRRILYNRIVEAKMRESTAASIVVQKYFRMWRQRTTYKKYRYAALVIQRWYMNVKEIQQAKSILEMLVKKHRMASKIQHWYRKQIAARKMLCIRDQYILHCIDMRMRSNASNLIKQTLRSIMLRKRFRNIVTCVIEREKVRKCILTQNIMAVRIQSYFRCYLERTAYMKLKCACIKIQSYFRKIIQRRIFLKFKYSTQVIETRYLAVLHMRKCRSNYENLYKTVLFLQRKYRARISMVSTRNTYLQLKHATELIQRKYRAKLALQCDRKLFLIMKTACIKIQSYFRMYVERRDYENLYKAVLFLQRKYRARISMVSTRNAYLQLKTATELIQRKYRAKLAMRCDRKSFLIMKTACITIQSYFRMYVERRDYENLYKAVLFLQRKYRARISMVSTRNAYLQLKHATELIQQKYRAKLAMRCDRKSFLIMKTACIKIQSYFRMYVERRDYENLYKAVLFLQRKYRARISMVSTRNAYLQLKHATELIQRKYRAKLAMRCDRKSFLIMKTACITIQSYFRMYVERRDYENLYKAVLFLQRKYRVRISMVSTRNAYLQLKHATELIQQKYRAKLAMRCDRKSFLIMKTACITIQSYFRMYVERRSYQNQKYACIKLQSHYKALSQRRKYLKLKCATIAIETRYKAILNMRKCRSDYEKLYKTIIFIQRLYKAKTEMISTRTKYLQLKCTTEFVQQKYRATKAMRYERDRFLQLKLACIKMQRRYRANKLRNWHVSQYQKLKNACVNIQSRFRSNRLMILARNNFSLKKTAAVAIQRYYRAHSKKKIEQKIYVHIRNSVVKIQTVFRSYLLTKQTRMKYVILRNTVITVQRRYRAIKEMQYYRHQYVTLKTASIVIQKTYRGRKDRDNYLKLLHATLMIQRQYRAYLLMKAARSAYWNMKNAATCIQTWYRATLQMKTERQIYRRKLEALRLLQVKVRATLLMKSQMKSYQQLRHAATVLQRHYRSIRLARQTHQELVRRTVTIQRWYRSIVLMRLHSRQFLKLKIATIVIQKHYRSTLAMRRDRRRFVNKRAAAIKIQRFYRSKCHMRLCRNEYAKKRTAALVIQTSYRMYKRRVRFLRLKMAAICIQRYIRSYSITKKFQESFQYTKFYIIKMQSMIRMSLHRKRYLRMREAVLILQLAYRQKKKIELARLERRKMILSAISIQKNCRTYLAMKRYKTLKRCVVTLQQRWRSILVMRTIRDEYTHKRNIIISIQSRIRGILARHEFAKKRRQLAVYFEERKKNFAVLKIQSVWRGHRVRKQMKDWTRLVKLRKRWQEGALRSNQETLSERNRDALQVLSHFRDVASVIRAFISLDLLTCVCPMLYLTDNKAKSVCSRIIMYIALTNRSISTLETLRLGSSIIVNMARYTPTALLVYEDDQVSYILKSMLKWCDKDSLLFCSLCTYLWLFGKYETIAQDLKKILKSDENFKMLCKIRGLVQRRKRMQENSVRQRSNLSSSYGNRSFNMSVNQSHLFKDNSPPTPQLEPDFGLAREGGVRFFQNELHAIDSVFLKFNIPIND